MKIALVGDVHGNAAALAVVLDAARAEKVELLLVTGDFVGYYYRPAEVLSLLDRWRFVAVRGNHEDYLVEAAKDPARRAAYRMKYGSGLERAYETLTPAQLAWLGALPRTASIRIEGLTVLLCHGSPRDTDEYIYPSSEPQIVNGLAAFGHDIVVMGHTHWRHVWRHDRVTAINPGSVGQPRDRQPGAAWALLDTATRDISLRNEVYDFAAVVAEAKQRDPHLPYLQQVLGRT